MREDDHYVYVPFCIIVTGFLMGYLNWVSMKFFR